jgi:putative transposase
MAAHSMSFQDTLTQLGSEDSLRDLIEFMLNRIMEADVAQRINADRHERTDEREKAILKNATALLMADELELTRR